MECTIQLAENDSKEAWCCNPHSADVKKFEEHYEWNSDEKYGSEEVAERIPGKNLPRWESCEGVEQKEIVRE